jgi:hypothetical protein
MHNMQQPKLLPALIMLLVLSSSCHKSTDDTPVNVNIVHAIINGDAVISYVGYNPAMTFPATAASIKFGAAAKYNTAGGANNVLVTTAASKTSLYSGTLNLDAGGIYSLFLCGTSTAPDTMLIKEQISNYSDSSAGVRFVNLSPQSPAMKVNIAGAAGTTVVDPIAYKQASAFIKFSATTSITGNKYTFEVRSAANDSLLLTYPWSYTRFRNNTLVITGYATQGSSPTLKIYPVNNY